MTQEIDDLDRIASRFLKRVTIDNPRFQEIVAACCLAVTGGCRIGLIDEAKHHILGKIGLGEPSDFGSTIERE